MENHEGSFGSSIQFAIIIQPWTLKIRLKDHKSSSLGIAMERVFSGTLPPRP